MDMFPQKSQFENYYPYIKGRDRGRITVILLVVFMLNGGFVLIRELECRHLALLLAAYSPQALTLQIVRYMGKLSEFYLLNFLYYFPTTTSIAHSIRNPYGFPAFSFILVKIVLYLISTSSGVLLSLRHSCSFSIGDIFFQFLHICLLWFGFGEWTSSNPVPMQLSSWKSAFLSFIEWLRKSLFL